jgi:hypothetical protein
VWRNEADERIATPSYGHDLDPAGEWVPGVER